MGLFQEICDPAFMTNIFTDSKYLNRAGLVCEVIFEYQENAYDIVLPRLVLY